MPEGFAIGSIPLEVLVGGSVNGVVFAGRLGRLLTHQMPSYRLVAFARESVWKRRVMTEAPKYQRTFLRNHKVSWE